MTRLDLLSWTLIASAASLGCNGQTASAADARGPEPDATIDARDDAAPPTVEDGSTDGPCVTPSVEAGVCTFCQSEWYCFGSVPFDVCPNQGEGTCTEGAAPCFYCSEHVEGYVCYCSAGDGGEPDASDADAGLTWQCQSNEMGCGS
jgi:hypothetical protein